MKTIFIRTWVLLVFLSSTAIANIDDEEYESYNDIVRRLSEPKASSTAKYDSGQSLGPAKTMFHGGVGLVNMYQVVELDGQFKEHIHSKGVQATVGIDLLSPDWLAEGSVRSFEPNNLAWTKLSLKEFDLKFIYKPRPAPKVSLRMGTGISARYSIYSRAGREDVAYTTPSALLIGGGDLFVTNAISLGVEGSARSALIGETIDQLSYDLTLRVDGHF